MNDTPETPRLQRVDIVDCQSMTDEQIMEKLHEVTELQEASGEEDVLHLMLTCPATATLEDVEEGKQQPGQLIATTAATSLQIGTTYLGLGQSQIRKSVERTMDANQITKAKIDFETYTRYSTPIG